MEQEKVLQNDCTNEDPEIKSQKTQKTAKYNNFFLSFTFFPKVKSPCQKEFILDCDNWKKAKLPTYNGLTDKYLTPFFQNSGIRNNLLRVGLINERNDIIETKKPVIMPFRKLDPIVQRKHICHLVPKRKATSTQSPPASQVTYSSTHGSKCVKKKQKSQFIYQFSTSKNKKTYYFDKLPPLKTPKQGTKIHLPEIYLEKNFQKFATEYLDFLNNASVTTNQSLERQFFEKYKSQKQKKVIRHYKPLHTQVRGVKEDSLAWRFHTELNHQQSPQIHLQDQFSQKKNNFYTESKQQQVTKEEDEDGEYEEEEFEKDANEKKKEQQDDYDDDDFSEKEEEPSNNNKNKDIEESDKEKESEKEEASYDQEFDNEAEQKEEEEEGEDIENEQPMEEEQEQKQKGDDDYGNDFDDEEIN